MTTLKYPFKSIELRWEDPRSWDGYTAEVAFGKGLEKETKFSVFAGDTPIGYFRFSPLPGCCGVVVSHDTFVYEKERKTVASQDFRSSKTELAKLFGYSCMIATTQMMNPASLKNMIKSGYDIKIQFINSRTTNLLGLGVKLL